MSYVYNYFTIVLCLMCTIISRLFNVLCVQLFHDCSMSYLYAIVSWRGTTPCIMCWKKTCDWSLYKKFKFSNFYYFSTIPIYWVAIHTPSIRPWMIHCQYDHAWYCGSTTMHNPLSIRPCTIHSQYDHACSTVNTTKHDTQSIRPCIIHCQYDHARYTVNTTMHDPLSIRPCTIHCQYDHAWSTVNTTMHNPLSIRPCTIHSQYDHAR